MADAGSEWERGISDFGDSIGSAIGSMMQRHRQEEDQFGKLQALRSMDDPAKPGHSLLPDKVWQPLEEMHRRHQAINAGQAQTLIQIYGGLAKTAAAAKLKSDAQSEAPTFFHDDEGNTFYKDSRGTHQVRKSSSSTTLSPEEKEEQKQVGKERAQQKAIWDAIDNPLNVEYGRPPKQVEVQKKLAKSTDQFVPTAPGTSESTKNTSDVTGKAGQPLVRVTGPDGKQHVIKRDVFENMKTAVPVKTRDEALKLKPGTLIRTPDGRLLRVPQKKTLTQSNGASGADDSSDSDDSNDAG